MWTPPAILRFYFSPRFGKHPGDLALPRKFELSAAVNRLRTLQVKFAPK
ncbi:hypothetical protein [Desulforamulus profundi]